MIYTDFQNIKLSALGLGAMRLPLKPGGGAADIDEERTCELVDYAIAHGVNYFDTAYPYHGGNSERVMGRALNRYPREQWYLASKYPGHQIADTYNPAEIFEEQLKKCGVEYFDFYLLHNVYENSIETYLDPKWGIVDYFVEQKRLGRIRHLGFSTHGGYEVIQRFIDHTGDAMEFCQMQLNYLDWTLQDGKSRYELLKRHGIPVWVMEPLRGGKLAHLPEEAVTELRELYPDKTDAAWSFEWLMGLENVKVTLSGMSDMAQMQENVRTYEEGKALNAEERAALERTGEKLHKGLPCTACRYCCDVCPMELDIPRLIEIFNDVSYQPHFTPAMRLDVLPPEKMPSACIGCGACARICPQGLNPGKAMGELTEILKTIPKWADMCRERAEAAKKNR